MTHEPSPHDEQAQLSAPVSATAGSEPGGASELPAEVEPDRLPRALFGYDRSTIVELLGTMSERIRVLVQDRIDRERRIGELEIEIGRNQENQRLIGETLVAAREEAESIREDARRSAENALHAARKQADRILEESELKARAQAKELVEAGQRERQALVDNGQRERQALLDEAGRARAFVEETHEQLSDFLMAAVRWYERVKPSSDARPSISADRETEAQEPSNPANDRSSIPSA